MNIAPNYNGQPEDCSGSGIYAKLTAENVTYDGNLVYGDVVIRFYSDAACTIPYSVNNLSLVYSEHRYSYPDDYDDGGIDITYGCSGFESILENGKLLSYHDPLAGFIYSFYLQPGNGYSIVNAWPEL